MMKTTTTLTMTSSTTTAFKFLFLSTAIALELFDGIKKRMADNVVLKLHSSFLVPMSEHLYGEIQQKITRFTDAELDTMFEV